jgi:hypothetical protein
VADLSTILAKAAPWLAAAAAGPAGLAGMAIKTAAEALGAPAASTVDDVATAVMGAKPEQLAALKMAELDFKLRMQELGFKTETDILTITAADRADARKTYAATGSRVPAMLTCFVVGAFTTTLILLLKFDVPATNRDIVVYMIGQLSGGFTSALAFWLGTTKDSGKKTDGILAKLDGR